MPFLEGVLDLFVNWYICLYNLTNEQLSKLEGIDEMYLRRIFDVPKSTPKSQQFQLTQIYFCFSYLLFKFYFVSI